MPGPGSVAVPKPIRGQRLLDKDARAKEAKAIEAREKKAAKRRDGGRCRWPEKHFCKGGMESAHIRDASLGGDMHRSNLVTLCAWLHRRGPVSIHGKQLYIEPQTAVGADGALAFYQQGVDGNMYLVAREVAVGVLEKVGERNSEGA